MTLVELLVTILIISILGALVLGVAAVAGETAREARSRNMIARIHTLLVEHMDTYKTRRVKLRPTIGTVDGVEEIISQSGMNSRQRREAITEARLYAHREMMLMEMPDRWSDVALAAVGTTVRDPLYLDAPVLPSMGNRRRTPLASVFLRKYQRMIDAGVDADTIIANQGAECLYMIVTLATADGEARTLFHESNIGDTDGDGAPEFLDGWGHPVEFIRWAPGFDSEIQANANELDDPVPPATLATAWSAAATSDHDPYDAYRVDATAFRMMPLVYSAGRDEEPGLPLTANYVVWSPAAAVQVNPSNFPYLAPPLNPYAKARDDNGNFAYLGTDDGNKTMVDNIHNHLIGER